VLCYYIKKGKRMTRLLETLSCAALAFGFAVLPATAEEKSAWRLFVSDHAEPVVRAIDAATGTVLANFATKGTATLHRSESGRTVFAVQSKSDMISVISSGVSMGDHGDHGDLKIEAPSLLEASFPGAKPSHFVDHHGDIALFFDGEGVARTVSEKDVLAGSQTVREVKTAPHHGVAVAFGDHVLVTEPNSEKPDELPAGIRVIDSAGAPVGDVHSCPDLHGEASSGNILAIACAEGLLLVKGGDGAPSIELLPYGDGLPEGKSTTLVGGRGLQYFLGNYGPSAVVLIDPTAQDAFRLVELPARRVHFAVDPARPKFAYVFTEDGSLHRIDVLAGEIVGSLALTEPYSMDGHWSDPRPRIAIAGDSIVVSDPLKGLLHVVDAVGFAETGIIPVEGKPFNIVAVGGSGETH
jgi:zinc transport system substrate-binding protein